MPLANAAKRGGAFSAVPTTVAVFVVTPSVEMYCRTIGARTDADPASARPNPSSRVLLPSAITSSGMSS